MGNLIDKVIDVVRPDELGEIPEASQLCESVHPDIRQATQDGVGDPGVDVVDGVYVVGNNIQREAGVADSHLIRPSRIRSEGPAPGSRLSARVNVGLEGRLQLRG